MPRAVSLETRALGPGDAEEEPTDHALNTAMSLKALRSATASMRSEASSLRQRATSPSARQLPSELQECSSSAFTASIESSADDEVLSPRAAALTSTPRRQANKLREARNQRSMRQLAASTSSLEPGSFNKLEVGQLSARKVPGETPRARPSAHSAGPESASSGSEFTPPNRAGRPRSAASGLKVVPAELGYLHDFATGATDQFALTHPEWADFAVEVRALVDEQVELHVKACSKCRAFSSFAKHVTAKKKQHLNEFTLASLCKDQLKLLNRHVAEVVLREKDAMLAVMAESMSVPLDDLISYEVVAQHRCDASSSSLEFFAAERDRVLEQAPMREELNVVLAMIRKVRAAHQSWRRAASRFRGGIIPHKRMSAVNSEDVEECATEQLRDLTTMAAALTEEWKRKWNPLSFNEVFSIFGIPLFDHELEIPSGTAPRPRSGVAIPSDGAWAKRALDEAPVSSQELNTLRPMSISVRIRPPLAHEAGDELTASVLPDGVTVAFKDAMGPGSASHRLAFDAAIQGSQEEMFSRCGVKSLVHKALEGYTATVFAYGQTGTGKTHSLLGPEGSIMQLAEDEVIDEHGLLPPACRKLVDDARCCKVGKQGLLPRAVQFLWKLLKKDGASPCVRVSFMELYNEKVYDLLNPSGQLEVRQKSANEQGFHVPGLTVCEAASPETVLQALRQGITIRHSQGHSMSRDSSRGHAIFTLEFERNRKMGKLIFADLAGSERSKRIQGANSQETANINKSLFTLSNCISALASGSGDVSVSSAFRNSKLTKLLMGSLCGQGYTLLIAAVSPAARNFDETASTLFFAAKCANIKRQLAPHLSSHGREVQELKATIEALRAELAKANEIAGAAASTGNRESVIGCAAVEDQAHANLELQRELENLREELEEERLTREALQQQAQESELLREELDIERRRGRALQREIKDTVIELKAECREQVEAKESALQNDLRGQLDMQNLRVSSLERELESERQRSAVLEQEIQAVGALAASELECLCKDLEAERQRAGLLQHENELLKKELRRQPERSKEPRPAEREEPMTVQVYMLEDPQAHTLQTSPVSYSGPSEGGFSETEIMSTQQLDGMLNPTSTTSSEEALGAQQLDTSESTDRSPDRKALDALEARLAAVEAEVLGANAVQDVTSQATLEEALKMRRGSEDSQESKPLQWPVQIEVDDLAAPSGLQLSPITPTPELCGESNSGILVAYDEDVSRPAGKQTVYATATSKPEIFALSPNLDVMNVSSSESQADEHNESADEDLSIDVDLANQVPASEECADKDLSIDVDLANQVPASACRSPAESEFSC